MDVELLSEYKDFLLRKKEEGSQIVAFLAHDNIPEELIHAAGLVPLRMIFAGNQELMNSSHEYLPASTCSFAQSCIGLFSMKPSTFEFLEEVDYFIVSNHCVSDICASEIISKYFFIPRINFYVPYSISETSMKYYREELSLFKKELESVSEKPISDEDIIESIKQYNELKNLLSELAMTCMNGVEKLKIFQRAILFGVDYIPDLKITIKEAKKTQNSNNAKNLILTGCSIFVGDFLIDIIQESGANIVLFDTWVGRGYYSQVISEKDIREVKDPLELFVKRFKDNIHGDHVVPNFLTNKVNLLSAEVKNYNHGSKIAIINHIIKFCDHITMFQSLLKEELQQKGIPVLNLERDYSKANRGQLTTRIEAFLEML